MVRGCGGTLCRELAQHMSAAVPQEQTCVVHGYLRLLVLLLHTADTM